MATPHLEAFDRMFEAIMQLKTIDECYAFFEDICTIRELMDISQRLEVALLLHRGLSYQEVAQRIGVSSATISRVKRCLDYGSGGYQLVIDRMGENNGN